MNLLDTVAANDAWPEKLTRETKLSSQSTKPNNIDNPLTPTSRSFRGAQSDASEAASGETVPSSIVDENLPQTGSFHTLTNKSLNNECNPTHDEGIPLSNSKEASNHVDDENVDPKTVVIHAVGPLGDLKSNSSMKADKGHQSSSCPSKLRVAPLRRHTSPPPRRNSELMAETDMRGIFATRVSPTLNQNPSLKNSLVPLSARANSTADISKLKNAANKDFFEDEISRMRNSIIVKRNIKKQQRIDTSEDENVFLGNRISEGHENFVMAYNMLTGIRVAVSRCSGMMKKINNDDFKNTKKLTFNMDGNELTPSSKYDFKFKDYCPEVFRELRSLFGVDPADYLISITGKYILSELGSPGKSGSFFYYSRDFRFIIKTIHHSEHKQLRRILKDYYHHVKTNPNTLISQFYGLHRLKVRGSIKKVHFIVMNNLFPPHRDIHCKYDLKGSTWGRYTKLPADDQSLLDYSHITLKDINWLERKEEIHFGPKKRNIFLEQLRADVGFLKKINAMDYSLLLGVHDVQKGNSNTITNLSVFDPKSNSKNDLIKTNPRDINREADLPARNFPGRSKYIFYGHDGGIRGTNEENEPMRVIYYLGIIDCLTSYSMKKKLETLIRSVSQSRSTISAVPAREYGDRFFKFIQKSVSNNKTKKS